MEFPNITDFSHELLCQILKYLPLREILSVAMLCKKMATAVDMHLRLCKSIDFCQDAVCGYMPSTITDDHLLTLFKKCPHLETVYGLHPVKIERRRLRKRSALTIPGIIEALNLCFHLKAVETSDLRLFEAIMQLLPHIEIIGHFQNRDGLFPPQASQRLKLQPYPRISSLHLIGVEVPELTAMPHLQHLHLQCVRFTKLQPFRAFLAQNLKSFVMKHCIGPSVPQRYLSLIIALSSSPNLSHLELVRVPLLNGLFQRAVEDSYRHNGFVNLRTLVISGCKGVLEADLGHLMIVSSKNLETLYIQPSLTKDSLFVSLSYAQCVFPRLQNLHLGYIDTLNSSGEWSNDALLSLGLAEVPDTPSSITDSGMKVISELFPHIKTMSVSNCPHLMIMYHWMSAEDNEAWSRLTDLTLQKCHCLQLSSFAVFISFLSNIEVIILNDMFREPPKGCSHVGLSAGTGLGMSSAVVSNQDEHIAVQGHHQDFEHPGDEENEENEREFVDVENEEPHFMVLQRDFFDGEEEEEDDEGADAVLDDQDPAVILEQQNIEERSSAENCVTDNSLQIKEKALVKENNVFNDEPSSSVEDKMLHSPSNATSSDVKIVNAHEVNYQKIHPSLPSMKSVHVQCDTLSEDCHESSNSETLKKNSFHSNDMSDDSYKSDDDIKICVCSKLSDYNYDTDYDPHKPSTSKAGSHLDYCAPCDRKSFKTSDSETDHFDELQKATKQSKESLEQKIFKTEFINPDTDELAARTNSCLKLDVNDLQTNGPCGAENSILSDIPDNSPVSQNPFSTRNLSLDEVCKPCVVLVGRLDYSDNSAGNSSVILDHERSSFQNDVPTIISYNSSEKENKFLSENDVNECHSPGFVKNSYLANGSIEMSPDISNFNDFLKDADKMLVQNTENSIREISLLGNEDGSDNMICGFLERLDNVHHNEVLENCVENAELKGDTSLQIGGDTPKICSSLPGMDKDSLNNIPTESEEFPQKWENLSHEDTSAKEYCVPMETESLHDSFDKTESDSSHWYDNSSYSSNKNKKQDILNINAVKQNSSPKYEVPVPCSEIYKQYVPRDERAPDMKDFYTTSGNIKSDNKLTLKGEGSSHFQPNKVVLNVETPEILEKDIHASDANDFLSENIRSVQETITEINTEKKEVTSYFNTSDKSTKIQDELCGTFNKRCSNDSCKIESCESLVIEKQNTNLVITLAETNSVADDMKDSVCTTDKVTGISESTSSETHSKYSDIHDTYQPSISINKNNYNENSVKSTRSAKSANLVNHANNEASDFQTKKCTNSNTSRKNEKLELSTSGVQGVKRNLKDKNQSQENFEAESEPSVPIAKRLRTCEDRNNNDDDDSKYYVLVSGTTADIVNSLTGESHRLPTCSVLLTKYDKCNTSGKVQKNFNSSMNCNPCLASGSEDGSQCQSFTETCKLQTGVKCSQKCDVNNRKINKRYPVRTKIRQRNSDKIEDGLKCCKEDFKKKCDCSRKSNKHSNICDHHSCSSSSLKVRKERLKIANSYAAVIIENQTEKENLLNLPVDSKNYVENDGNSEYSNQMVIKKESEGVMSNSSEKYSDGYHNNNKHSKNNTSDSAEINVTHNVRRTRKKRIPFSQKQSKKLSRNSVSKSEHLNKHTRNTSKKIPTVPTVCLISQGTQANSADIRRSVRRIRRATAQARRTMSPIRVSRNSTHSNKISAKTLNKKPVNMNPRPEMQDKATSTSDPLLEDDAVQTLQLTSKTLLSFTVVSCGISDIIIDHCSKLFHIEVQACRILKKFHLDYCPAMKRLNVSQCPKLSICALAAPVMSVEPDSYFLVSYEPCMQGYHPGEGEKAILSRATLDQNVLICHDISAISHEGFQAMFKEKLVVWLRYLSKVHAVLKTKSKNTGKKVEESVSSEYPWSHDLRRMHGKYAYLTSTDFCHSDGRYELVTNSPIFCDVFETHQLDTGFPAIDDCEALRNISLISLEAREKSAKMDTKFIGFYIPVTENNQINF